MMPAGPARRHDGGRGLEGRASEPERRGAARPPFGARPARTHQGESR